MRKSNNQNGRRGTTKVIRVDDFDESITPAKVREIFSCRGRVGTIRIASYLNETVVSFELHDMIDDDLMEPVRWNGMKIIMEEGWAW